MNNITLGSLFDGIGGFPYAAKLIGIETIWASEIEKAPISITKRHFPGMKHLGDITKLNGAEIDPVDIITFGSPCQGLSIAGAGKGLEDERSGLFLEAIRVIREMREAAYGVYPRIIVWENVPGAFSSNKGHDFRTVLEEIAETEIPMPAGGKWANAGMVELPDRQIAWRVLDARYWGVPQRRNRIFLVCDFGNECAGEILFERESLSGDYTPGGAQGQGVTGCASVCALDADDNVAFTNRGATGGGVAVFGETGQGYWQNGAQTLRAEGENRPSRPGHVVSDARGNGDRLIVPTMTGDHQNRVTDYTAIVIDCRNDSANVEVSGTLQAKSGGGYSLNYINPILTYQRVTGTLSPGAHPGGFNGQDAINDMLVANGQIVRRLTPTECERLMGYPDSWTAYGCDGESISDAARYRALGNSVAIPCVLYVLEGVKQALLKSP